MAPERADDLRPYGQPCDPDPRTFQDHCGPILTCNAVDVGTWRCGLPEMCAHDSACPAGLICRNGYCRSPGC